MNISKKEISQIADLCRLKLTEEEKKRFTADLGAILGYIAKIKEADTEKVEPLYKTVNLKNRTRDDKKEDFSGKEKIVKNAPCSKNNFFEVKSVFKK